MVTEEKKYRDVLKATTLIGGSSLFTILIGMIRTKFVAILIGPGGVGLLGVLSGINSIVSIVSGMGLNMSGVRQVAETLGRNDDESTARTVFTLRRTVFLSGFIGLVLMTIGSPVLSNIAFEDGSYTIPIAFLGISVFFTAVSSGQTSILQGFRRIADLAKIGIISSLNGLLVSVPCYFFWSRNGIVPALIIASLVTLLTSWWFSHRIVIVPVKLRWHEMRQEALRMLGFGFPLMISALIPLITTNFINIFLTRQAGLDSVGLYQAAYNLSGILVNFVLSAMGTDYYPRLTGMAKDDQKIRREVNVQTEIALLLAVPAIALTIVFMPLAVKLFYSGHFDGSVKILRWAVFGIFGRVVSWPMGFIILAKGKGRLFLIVEIITGCVNLLLLWFGYSLWGLQGTGIAFALLYLFQTVFMVIVSSAIAHMRWTRTVFIQIIGSLIVLAVLSTVSAAEMNLLIKWVFSGIVLVAITMMSFRRLSRFSGIGFKALMHKFVRKKIG